MKQIKFLILGIILLALIGNINAYSSNTFNNSLTNENLTFTGNQNITRWLSVPSNTLLINGYLNLSGYSYGFCCQEFSNVSSCNNYSENTGLYFANYGIEPNYFYINYTKPNNLLNAIWQVKHGKLSTYNVTIPNSCLNFFQDTLLLRFFSASRQAGVDESYGQCYNGNWINITQIESFDDGFSCSYSSDFSYKMYDGDYSTYSSSCIGGTTGWGSGVESSRIYEEAIIWNNNTLNANYPNNLLFYINNVIVWNYTNQFNKLNNKTNNLANYINSYLTSCSYIAGFCYVPFTFHSDTSGILQYSNLIFNNIGISENNVNYTTSILEGQSNTITGNFTLSTPDSIVLNYNGLNYTPNINLVGYNYVLTNTLTSPLVTSNSNISFYYIFTINGTTYNSNTYNQSITNIVLSINCTNNYNFINFINYDEENLNQINGTVEYILTLLSNSNELSSINGSVYGSNLSLCSNENLTNSYTNYNLQLRYYDTNYLYKTYNIQNNQITNIPINLNLYYLNSSIGTQFKINYVDFNYLTYPNAIIQIQRQYLYSNSYNVVEIPRMDNNGQAIGSFNTRNIRYKLIVINNGVILDTFNDIFPVCQNIVLGQCDLSLRGSQSNPSSNNGDFTYTLIKSNTSITLTYIIPSGTPRSINFIANQDSRFLSNITNCDISIFASGGTISCNYNQTIGDSIITTKIINSDGTTLYGTIQISEDLSSFFMLNNYFIAFVLLLSLALMLTSSAVMMVIGSVAGLFYLGLIFLLRGADLVTVVGSIAWLIVASVIIIYFVSKREERT